jgi:hypothetical protein
VQAGERALLEPDWADPRLVQPRAAFERRARPRETTGERALSLPHWGFAQKIAHPDADERSRSLAPAAAAAASPFPSCAAEPPKVQTVRDETGSWYTDSYDYGCLNISVSGDRNFDRALKPPVPEGAAVTPDCPAQPQQVSPAEEEDSDTKGSFELQITLNNLPYTISGQCFEGAEGFCRDRVAQCALVDRLIFMEGSQQ